jgi:hypothetical protein
MAPLAVVACRVFDLIVAGHAQEEGKKPLAAHKGGIKKAASDARGADADRGRPTGGVTGLLTR